MLCDLIGTEINCTGTGQDGEIQAGVLEEIRTLFINRRLDCPYIFHREGEPIQSFRKAWNSACIKAGLYEVLKENEEVVKISTKIFDDFRRTAIRDMVRSGVPERVAMSISGHKTRSVFERYNIVSEQDLKEASRKKQAYHEKQRIDQEKFDQKRGEIIPFKQVQNG